MRAFVVALGWAIVVDEWLVQQGGMSKMRIAIDSRSRLRGLVATEDLKAGDVACRVPGQLLYTSAKAEDHTVAPKVRTAELLAPMHNLLATVLLYDRKAGVNKPYFESLPTRGGLPLQYDGKALRLLDQSPTGRVVAMERSSVLHDYNTWRGLFSELGSEDDYVWARSMVKSRLIGLHSLAPGTPVNFALAPLVDMLNHASGSGNVEPSYSPDSGDMAVKVTKDTKAGEALEWTYGERSNPELFTRYGFTDPKYHVLSSFALFVNLTDFPAGDSPALRERKLATVMPMRSSRMNPDGTVFHVFSLGIDKLAGQELIADLRFLEANEARLNVCQQQNRNKSGCDPIDAVLERRALKRLAAIARQQLGNYSEDATTDEALLETELSWEERQAITVRLGEKTVLNGALNLVDRIDKLFDLNPSALQKDIKARWINSQVGSYVRGTIARLVIEETARWLRKQDKDRHEL